MIEFSKMSGRIKAGVKEKEGAALKLLAVQRREKIKALLLEKDTVTTNEIIDQFGISVETVRRDLDILENEGFLDKIYGGATLKKRTAAHPARALLDQTFVEGKKRVAARAVQFMKQGDTIFLDNSSAVFYMCPGLLEMDITVLTNSLRVANALSKSKHIRLICIGGQYEADEDAFLGPSAVSGMQKYQIDRAFLSCNSFDMRNGLMTTSEQIALMKQIVISSAQQRCLLVDHSKFGKASFVHMCEFGDIDRLFTDRPITPEWQSFFERHGIKVYICESGEGRFPALGEKPLEELLPEQTEEE